MTIFTCAIDLLKNRCTKQEKKYYFCRFVICSSQIYGYGVTCKLYVLSLSAGYNADIICLQEVDRKVFENELLPSLDLLGYTGSCKVKGQQGSEGVAMFIRAQKFRYKLKK